MCCLLCLRCFAPYSSPSAPPNRLYSMRAEAEEPKWSWLPFGTQASCKHSGFGYILEAQSPEFGDRIPSNISSAVNPYQLTLAQMKPRCCSCVSRYFLRPALLSSVLHSPFCYISGLMVCKDPDFSFSPTANSFSFL